MIFHHCLTNNNGNCLNNSGLWTDYKITTVEDQVKFTVPMNPDTATLFYNHRMLVDNKGAIEPRAWLISKLNRISPDGIVHVTLAQDIFDQHKDYIERDESGNVIGMWADYYVNQLGATDKEVTPDSDAPIEYTSTISYSGVKPELKVGGSSKTFTMQYFDGAGNLADHPCSWNYKFIDDDINPEDVLRIITA